MPFTIRLYSPIDFETLYALDSACYPRGIAYSRRTLKWFLMQPGAECLVAVQAEAPGEGRRFDIAHGPERKPKGSAGKEVQPEAPGRSSQQGARSTAQPVASGIHADPGVIGFIIAQADPPEAHIVTLDVSEPHRRAGAGSALLAQMEQRLAWRGVQYAVLETATSNEAAVAFWTRHGYRSVGVLRRYYLNKIDAYMMQKILTAEKFMGENRGPTEE